MTICPFCEDLVFPEDDHELILGMPAHTECAANERDFAQVKR